MMQMLEAGGLDILMDGIRQADPDNPEGYYEYERVKALSDGDIEWLVGARGKTVKIISALLHFLPSNYAYGVIFMQRSLPEILASQRKMLARRGEPADTIPDDKLAEIYARHLAQVERWLASQPNIQVLPMHYRDLIQAPATQAERVNEFLAGELDCEAMAGAVDPRLYRNRAS